MLVTSGRAGTVWFSVTVVLLLDRVQEELCSLKEMPVYYVVQVTCSFIINAFWSQSSFRQCWIMHEVRLDMTVARKYIAVL